MAQQQNGITAVEVNNRSRVIRFFVGTIDIALAYRPRRNDFREVYRCSIEGRRFSGTCRMTDAQYRAMMRQAHAIANDHEWKK